MSFADFDYSQKVTQITSQRDNTVAHIAALNAEIESLQAVSATYSAITAPSIATATQQIVYHGQNVTAWNNILAEITRIQALSSEDKAILYQLYVCSSEQLARWMCHMLFNTTEMIANTASILADTELTSDKCMMLMKLVLQKIHVSVNTQFY